MLGFKGHLGAGISRMLGGPGLGHRPPLRYSKALFMFSEVLLLIVFSICSTRARISFGSGSPTRPSPTPFCASSCLATLDLGVWGWGTHADLQLEGCALVQLSQANRKSVSVWFTPNLLSQILHSRACPCSKSWLGLFG